ncbi:ragulator complex LAMTOR1 [Pelobates cultripes]|uniref:Ragulator complex protein LAMTOR1 n=1 Tax=Pelobates cultripes TaxID=61616 RepID=A0AAD1VPQ4_PELCU|nr:ragulator complex LAMTOR1 [Pelobates cultripes]
MAHCQREDYIYMAGDIGSYNMTHCQQEDYIYIWLGILGVITWLTDQGEREHLLPPNQTIPNRTPNGSEPSSINNPTARTDEQALLSRILARTAQNIIDVSAVESQGMEQHECMDRARQYSMRLAKLSNNLTHWKKVPPLPSLTAQPHQILASDPVPYADIQQVSKIAAYAFSALSQIRVDAKEDLVVQFGIP